MLSEGRLVLAENQSVHKPLVKGQHSQIFTTHVPHQSNGLTFSHCPACWSCSVPCTSSELAIPHELCYSAEIQSTQNSLHGHHIAKIIILGVWASTHIYILWMDGWVCINWGLNIMRVWTSGLDAILMRIDTDRRTDWWSIRPLYLVWGHIISLVELSTRNLINLPVVFRIRLPVGTWEETLPQISKIELLKSKGRTSSNRISLVVCGLSSSLS